MLENRKTGVSATKVSTGHNSHCTKANAWFIHIRMLILHYIHLEV